MRVRFSAGANVVAAAALYDAVHPLICLIASEALLTAKSATVHLAACGICGLLVVNQAHVLVSTPLSRSRCCGGSETQSLHPCICSASEALLTERSATVHDRPQAAGTSCSAV